jgi:hypothetical protein
LNPKVVIEARDIDVESKVESGFTASEHRRALIVEKTIIHLKGAG